MRGKRRFARLPGQAARVAIFGAGLACARADAPPAEGPPRPASACGFGEHTPHARDVPMGGLIASPRDYDGKVVRTSGVLVISVEGDALYTDEEARDRRSKDKALALAFRSKDEFEAASKCDERRVTLEGVFVAPSGGGVRLYPGELTQLLLVRAEPN